jgi:hypothetical protein
MIFYYCVRAEPTPSRTTETLLISAPEPQRLREADTLTGSFPARQADSPVGSSVSGCKQQNYRSGGNRVLRFPR